MPETFVPDDFTVPAAFDGSGFRLEPLGPEHNERDHAAWMSSIEHICSTPGFPDGSWPSPMTLKRNLADLERHARDFSERKGFTYSILDGDEVIGCLYIYPTSEPDHDASVQSWVTADRAEMDPMVRRSIDRWLAADWPFESPDYASGE